MQKWEYLEIARWRKPKGYEASEWNREIELATLGQEGWELVAVTPQSSTREGLTTDERWVFKRLMRPIMERGVFAVELPLVHPDGQRNYVADLADLNRFITEGLEIVSVVAYPNNLTLAILKDRGF